MDDVVSLVVAQLEGAPLPIRLALEACNLKIESLEQRIATAQRLLADQVSIRDRLTAALEAQQQQQK
jgi:hypothetical protein